MLFEKTKKEKRPNRTQKGLSKDLAIALNLMERDLAFYAELQKALRITHGRKYDGFLTLCIYAGVANGDISFFSAKISTTNNRMERIIYARMLSVSICEYLDTIHGLIGNKFLRDLQNTPYQDLIELFKAIGKRYSILKTKYQKQVRVLRNNVGAHISANDGVDISKMILGIDVDELRIISLELVQYHIELTGLTTVIFERMLDEIS